MKLKPEILSNFYLFLCLEKLPIKNYLFLFHILKVETITENPSRLIIIKKQKIILIKLRREKEKKIRDQSIQPPLSQYHNCGGPAEWNSMNSW